MQRLREDFPEIYAGGTTEGVDISDYFKKWGYYATLVEVSKKDYFKFKKMLKENIRQIHVFLACNIDRKKAKYKAEKKLRQ